MSSSFPVVAATGSVELSAGQVLLVAGMLNGRREGRGMEDRGVHGDNESNTLLQVEEQRVPSSPSSNRKHALLPDMDYAGLDWGGGTVGAGWVGVRGSGSSMSSQVLWSTPTRLYPI